MSIVQSGGGGVIVWRMLSWHTLGPLILTRHHLNATAYLCIVADHVNPFMATIYLLSLIMATSNWFVET